MNSLEIKQIKCSAVRIEADRFYVLLDDGREIGVPYIWFPRLAKATQVQRLNWRIIGKGVGLHWEDIDEDISILALLDPLASPDNRTAYNA